MKLYFEFNEKILFTTVDCGDPMPPINGHVRYYSHTTEGVTIINVILDMYHPLQGLQLVTDMGDGFQHHSNITVQ